MALALPDTAMAVTIDVGDGDIHPKNKSAVGARLALAARAIAYGETIPYSGPVYDSMKVEGNRAVLSFTHVGNGLVAKGGDLKGFAIAGENGHFTSATATIEGDKVVVSNPAVAKPVAVRYGWANTPDVNLFNKEGLPATPFRTDVK
jgi:sialate O-acetylesterase